MRSGGASVPQLLPLRIVRLFGLTRSIRNPAGEVPTARKCETLDMYRLKT